MSAGTSLLLAIVVSLGISAIIVAVLWAPLQRLLATLCETGEASQFWVSFTSVTLFLSPLFFAMLSLTPRDSIEAAQVLRVALLAALFGASLALLVVGFKLADARPRSAPKPAQ